MTTRDNAAQYEHPNADELGAFAEHALGGAERQRMTAHLAGCGRCREIVFLAQEAAAETRVAAASAAPGRRGWWSGRLVWAAGAACVLVAAVAATVVVVRQQPVKWGEVASVREEAAARVVGGASPEGASRANLSPEGASSANRSPEGASPENLGDRAGAEPASAVQKEGAGRASARKAAAPHAVAGSAAAVTEMQAEAGTAEAPAAPLEFAAGAGPGGDAQPNLRSHAMRMAPMRAVGASHAGQAGALENHLEAAQPAPRTAASLPAQALTGSAPSFAARAALPANAEIGQMNTRVAVLPQNGRLDALQTQQAELALTRAAALPVSYAVRDGAIERRVEGRRMVLTLPGRARAAAVASLPTALLALDDSGAVFVSRDRGHQWSTVAKQWAGKAVTISVQGVTEPPGVTIPVSGAGVVKPAHAASEQGVSAAPVMRSETFSGSEPRGFFQLMNDEGKSWVSLDSGKTWLPR